MTPAGEISQANDAVIKQLGFQPAELQGKQIFEFLHPLDDTDAALLLDNLAKVKEPICVEMMASRISEETFEAEVTFSPIIRGARVESIVSTLRNVTAWKDLERMKDAFVSNVSHELRTPITSLRLNHSLMQKNPDDLDKYLGRFDRETPLPERVDRGPPAALVVGSRQNRTEN